IGERHRIGGAADVVDLHGLPSRSLTDPIIEQRGAPGEAVKPEKGVCRMANPPRCARPRHPQPPNISEMTRAITALSSSWGGYRFAGCRGNMKETLLRNPFDTIETPGVPMRTINRAATRSTPVCSHC